MLFLGVRNKYCLICAQAANKNQPVPDHQCFKNWSGSSSGMEADILMDGFTKSVEMYGLKYVRFIGDGDSNVYKKVLDSRPYDNITIEKIECKNHLLRNVCNKLKDLVRNSKYGNVTLRKIVGSRILRIRTAITMAVRFRKNESEKSMMQKVTELRKDILNIPFHVYGEHNKCDSYFCDKKKNEKNYVPLLRESGLLFKILDYINNVIDHSKSLLFEANNNVVEEFNNIVAKFVGGKRINYCFRRSYQARCNAAVVAHNSRMPFYTMYKNMFYNSPGLYSKLSEKRRNMKRIRNSCNRKKYKRRQLFPEEKSNHSYGKQAEKPDLGPEEYLSKKEIFLTKLRLTESDRQKIIEETVLQSLCPIWLEERRKRLTASNFGYVCNRLPHTKCDALVKKMLYYKLNTYSLKYGRRHEKDAIEYLKSVKIDVRPSGLIIDEELPFLAASPDGLIDNTGIVEIKCPSSCSDITPDEAISSRKVTFWSKNKQSNKLILNKKHIYFYQVQGQLHISKRDYCLFVLWTPKGTKIERIDKDDSFWETNMKEKLIKFYFDCLLPELIDPRFPRSLPIRNPQYIIDAQKIRTIKVSKD